MKTLFSLTLIALSFSANSFSKKIELETSNLSAEVSFSLTGNWCDGTLTLEANLAESGGIYRWMKDGIVIKGTDTKSLNVNDHGLGNYTISYQSNSGNTITDTYNFTSAPGPESNFEFTNHPPIGATRFVDQSIAGDAPITGWHWDFGDGTSSNEKNPEQFYTAKNTYTVILTTTDSNGCSNSITTLVETNY